MDNGEGLDVGTHITATRYHLYHPTGKRRKHGCEPIEVEHPLEYLEVNRGSQYQENWNNDQVLQ